MTDPPFTLPPGLNRCPVPECPSKVRFVPYWRLNEHMKMKHAWPRKQTQPHLDKRLGNHFATNHKKRRSSAAFDDSIDGDEVEKRPRRSGANKDYSRLFENPYEAGIPVKKTLIVKLPVGAESLNSPSTSLHQSTLIPPSPPLSNSDEQPVQKAELLLPDPIDPVDHFLTDLAKSYLAELDEASFLSRSLPYPSSKPVQNTRVQHIAHQHRPDNADLSSTTIAPTLRNLLSSEIRRASLLTPERSRALLPVYRALAIYANTSSFASSFGNFPSTASLTSASIASSTPSPIKHRRVHSTGGDSKLGTPSTPTIATFTFSGPRTQPWEFEQSPVRARVKKEEKRRRVSSAILTSATSQVESQTNMQPLQPPAQGQSLSPTQSRIPNQTQSQMQPPSAKTGIKLRLKLTPAKAVGETAVATSSV